LEEEIRYHASEVLKKNPKFPVRFGKHNEVQQPNNKELTIEAWGKLRLSGWKKIVAEAKPVLNASL
jgi:hypothetical protein